VWSNGRVLWWRAADGEGITWPAADPDGTAARLTEDLATTGERQDSPVPPHPEPS